LGQITILLASKEINRKDGSFLKKNLYGKKFKKIKAERVGTLPSKNNVGMRRDVFCEKKRKEGQKRWRPFRRVTDESIEGRYQWGRTLMVHGPSKPTLRNGKIGSDLH